MHDAVTLLNKAYQDLIAVCAQIGDYRWADAQDIDKLTWCISEVKYWSQRVQTVVHARDQPACPTIQ